VIGEGNYDIGHLFGATKVEMLDASAACVFHLLLIFRWKGSAYTSPADGVPQGDTFDIDFVVHEIGHQLGKSYFSHELEETCKCKCRTGKWFNNYGVCWYYN
jgi:hypothetical protein